jgi:hypothetical protein
MVNKRRLFLFFLGLMFVGAFLRTYRINSFGLYGDEKQSILIAVANTNYGGMGNLLLPPATFTPSDFWKSRGIKSWLDADARGDVSGNSLVHDMSLKLFAFLFGKSDGSLRMVSVLFNVLTLWLLFYWARRLRPNQEVWPLGVLLLAVIEPFFVIYSQQARNYTTSIFFTTASNYFFWNMIIKGDQSAIKSKDLLGWILTSLFALFSTYLTALVLVGQLVYLVLFSKTTWLKWKTMAAGSLGFLIPFFSWMYWGPGQYAYELQKDSGSQYLKYLKANGPVLGWIEESNAINLFKKSIYILSDTFFLTNDLYNRHGYKIGFIILIAFFILVLTSISKLKEKCEKNFYFFGLIQIVLPIIFLIMAALNAGTTTGFFHRYASFSIPFGIFISVGVIDYLMKLNIWVKGLIMLIAITQIYFLILQVKPLYTDSKQKYTFSSNRGINPYPIIANKIIENYQPGDTVLYPSKLSNFLNAKHLKNRIADVSDAQLVNLYLDNRFNFIQKIDTAYKDSVILKKPNGHKLLIFDFEKGKYRY